MSATGDAQNVIHALINSGVRDAVLAPGSRSGPLALGLIDAEASGALRLHVRVDEREAAFLALGLAKASRRPAVVVTTSGTAVANLHPAMLEALHSRIPLVAITADRPDRLRGTGANQTTEQREIFPGVRFGADHRAIYDLVARRLSAPAHINLELDEPLVEQIDWQFAPLDESGWQAFGRDDPRPSLAIGPRTVVVAGDDAKQPARLLAENAAWPLLAEPSSGSRNGDNALIAYRLLLQHSPLAEQIERVVSFGHATLSRPVTRLLARTDIEIVHVGAQDTFPVPAGANVRFIDGVDVGDPDGPTWLSDWKAADAKATAAIDELIPGTPYEVARIVNQSVSPEGLLFIGSSNPIRDLDLVARPYTVGERRLVIANRGLAGIDGTLSSAIGAALARTSSRSIAYVGDLTFLHGSNGLLIGPNEPRPDLTIVVASDDGGSIFATLEQGAPEYAASFERVFATPTGASIAGLCHGYGVPHRLVPAAELALALDEPTEGLRVLEVPVDRLGRPALSAAIDEAVSSALRP